MKQVLLMLLLLSLCLLPAVRTEAATRLADVFGEHMVLQRDMQVPVWGWAEPGTPVTVTIAGQKHSATTGPDGKWILKLDSMPAGGPHEMRVAGGNEIVLQDVLVGEVWICSGQSNMEFSVGAIQISKETLKEDADPDLRLFMYTNRFDTQMEPLEHQPGTWHPDTSDRTLAFSAVGYFFGKKLRKELGVPVGLIKCAVGGTSAEAWTSRPVLESEFPSILENYVKKIPENYEGVRQQYELDRAAWGGEVARAQAAGTKAPAMPARPMGPKHPSAPTVLFNGMVHPLIPFAIRGVVWYQGESNSGRAAEYEKLLPAMVRDWSTRWGCDFSFGIVQLVNFRERTGDPNEKSGWADLREAQLHIVQNDPLAGLAVGIDVGEADQIHPKNKKPIGDRLGLWALAKVYGRDIPYSGPIYREMKKDDGKIRLFFDYVYDGLKTSDGEAPKGFAVAGEDGVYHWANARIDGDTVVVSSDLVANPVAVRYAWGDNPEATLCNRAGLPASPFRTDNSQ
ncbi:sialate O-acetylesterase [bacterium]|nr:sialate O-acetylesterase [bacterium]